MINPCLSNKTNGYWLNDILLWGLLLNLHHFAMVCEFVFASTWTWTFSQSKSNFVAHLAPYITPLFWRGVVEEKYVTLADRNPNIHKHGSLRKDYVAYGDHWLQFIFPGCLSHYSHPFANEISTALSSCGYIGISQITSNKQLIDEMKFHIYENMNLKLSLPWKIYQY